MVCVLLADHRGTDIEMERVMHMYSTPICASNFGSHLFRETSCQAKGRTCHLSYHLHRPSPISPLNHLVKSWTDAR